MNFQPELAEAVKDGRKTVTRRLVSDNPRSPYHPTRIGLMIGKSIAICPGRGRPAIDRRRVVSIGREQFYPATIDHREAQREGFANWEQFADAWADLHGTSRHLVDVWRIELASA